MTNFENTIKHPIPEELREWLLRVGVGAAPNYGLNLYLGDPPNQLEPSANLQGDFQNLTDVTPTHIQGLIDMALLERPNASGDLKLPPMVSTLSDMGGADLLGLGDAGCCTDYVMPLTGELRGKIFYRTEETIDEDDNEFGGCFWPQGLAKALPHPNFMNRTLKYEKDAGKIYGFFDWIENWLTEGIYFIENNSEYKRQLNDWRTKNLGWSSKSENTLVRFLRKFGFN